MSDRPLYSNRLIHEKSPYLLQHAHNPVDWYPWGEEAFHAAKSSDKPIFLSIGYATCHWCHVMERESFEDTGVAQMMNEHFINIKVDREELPEVDSLYMEFAQSMMAGSAGWPLNVILTPELQPFFAATYLPAYSNHGLMGLTDLISRIGELWASEDREKIVTQAEKIVEVFAQSIQVSGEEIPEYEEIINAADLLYKMADAAYGGIKGSPKFPIGYQYSFLLRHFILTQDSRALFLTERTLDMMHRGGIYDHIGGGFSRYSVDEKWFLPHFEKMLYDNAILAQAYTEAWQATKKPLYKEIAQEIFKYILRDMTHSEGGFYSAEDADSEGHEGFFYTWEYQEVMKILGVEGELFCKFYSIEPGGNFDGRSILHTPLIDEEFSAANAIPLDQLKTLFERQRKMLFEAREQRVHPLKDDKILSSWNGLMIYSLAEASLAFDKKEYLEAAAKAARFIKRHLWHEGQLLRRWREGEAMHPAGLDEYAYMIRGILSLFEANAGTEWLQWAIEMAQILKSNFKAEEGAFFQTTGTDKNLILRKCQFSDGAEPSGNAVHCENLLRLYLFTADEAYLTQSEDILKAASEFIENYPPGYAYHIMNLQRYYNENSPTIVIALNSNKDHEPDLKDALYSRFIPHRAIIWQTQDVELEELLSYTKDQISIDDKTTLYVCFHGVCQAPLTELQAMKEAIAKL
ncbi:MAG: thioredoxin domain-containing protein [Parachlamydia sp.]|jgi:hypothetical protein|nr:thioredoxin domain-containing protein [Parachlamydia sp.]